MDTQVLTVLSTRLLFGSVIVAGCSGLVRFRRLPPSLRYLALLAGFDMLMELTSKALVEILHLKSNLFLIPTVAIGEVALLALAYREALQSATFNRIMPWVVGIFSLYALADTFVRFGLIHYHIGVQITSDLLQFTLAMLFFWKLLSELHVEHLRYEPFFWVSVGLVVYVLGDLFISLFSNYLLAHYSHDLQFMIIRVVRLWFIIVLYCAYSLALWMRPLKSSSLSY